MGILDVNFQVPKIMNLFNISILLLLITISLLTLAEGFRIAQDQDSYPWENCNSFESTKKNCPRGETCLKLKTYTTYAWNWAMRCNITFRNRAISYYYPSCHFISGQGREEAISRFQFQSNGLK